MIQDTKEIKEKLADIFKANNSWPFTKHPELMDDLTNWIMKEIDEAWNQGMVDSPRNL